jgi:hypothetical protein
MNLTGVFVKVCGWELRKLWWFSHEIAVVSICAGIIIVQWLSPLTVIKFTTKTDAKTEYPDFTSFFHNMYIHSFFLEHKPVDFCSCICMSVNEHNLLPNIISSLWHKHTILTMKPV